jgi:radical SAM superfamily enzyme YgiQ (UPF0313 family)
VVAELKLLSEKYPFNSVKFYDYTFTQDPAWVEEFCDHYKDVGKAFWIQSRADLIVRNPKLISMLKKVGAKMIGVGFESGSDRILRILRKGSTLDINLKAAKIIKENDILLSGAYMLGIPGETREDVEKTIDMIENMKPEFTSVNFFTPIPGNDLYLECKKKDLIINDHPETWVEFSPEVPKIKGIDYDYLRNAAARIMGIKFGSGVVGKIIRYFYVKTKYNYKLRRFLVYFYCKWIQSSLHKFFNGELFSSRPFFQKK